MLKTIRARTFLVVMATTLFAVAITSALIIRLASNAAELSAANSLEKDSLIYSELLVYGLDHSSWADVQDTVEELSLTFNRRIVLTTPQRQVLADSAGLENKSKAFPSRVSAVIDPSTSEYDWFANPYFVEEPELVDLEPGLDDLEPDLDDNGDLFSDVDPFADADLDSEFFEGEPFPEGEPFSENDPYFDEEIELTDEQYERLNELYGDSNDLNSNVAPEAWLYLGQQLNLDPFASGTRAQTVLSLLALLFAAGLGAWFLSSKLSRPFRQLATGANQLRSGDYQARVATTGTAEAASLGESFNQLAMSLERNETQRKRMVSDIAHELRNPLTTLSGTIEAAQDGILELSDSTLSSLRDDADHLIGLVDDLSVLMDADESGLSIEIGEVDLVDLANSTLEAHAALALEHGCELSVGFVDSHLGGSEVLVSGDATRLRQVLGNLVSNAIVYSASADAAVVPQVEILVEAAAISVKDNGPGMSAEQQAQAFERFWRADPSRTRASGGFGLGLAIAKDLCQAQNLSIAVQSEVGVGTVFRVAGFSAVAV